MFSFIETRAFTKLVLEYLTDAEYVALQSALIADPEAGPVVPGSGGVRKLRWAAPGRGKRGGYRVIYYVRRANGIIWMLTMYPKNVADSIPAHVLRQIREEVDNAQGKAKYWPGDSGRASRVEARRSQSRYQCTRRCVNPREDRSVAVTLCGAARRFRAHAAGLGARPTRAFGCGANVVARR